MIVIEGQGQIVQKFQDLGLEFYDFFDHLKVNSIQAFNKHPLQRRPEVVILDYSALLENPVEVEDFKIHLNTYAGVVVICQTEEERKKALDFANIVPKVLGIYGPKLDMKEAALLGNLLSYFWATTQEHRFFQQKMYQFSLEIDQLVQGAQEDMMRAQDLHEKLLPKRTQVIKGINFFSKYASGTGRGVEFFDIIQNGNKCSTVFLSTDSYLASGNLLTLLERHKTEGFKTDHFLKEAWADIATLQEGRGKPIEIDLGIVEVDLNELKMSFHGKSILKVIMDGKLIDVNQEFQLAKDKKITILSAGYVKNLNQLTIPFNVEKTYNQHAHLSPHELLNEMIIKVKSDQEFNKDMSDMVAVMMEVNRHVMHQV